ncbi:amino acid ABC transporter substrate-binding protein [Mangrovactinospora gilvigrisea]|uniref:Amino acid ABC transporter substrate-binding protein n=1 Tax=Mangrovactinospora gilvigrisea TaxID=1428644 RepID=A0A1J7BJR7_9ACTN|nr:ABC transporter substrate-binding protein [Mangrovactinospora gilvigrisea]OIV38927.1 amino acid ABC transporter substrate-binding protein [Mangrovactinospora gilvigrisea]
MKRTLPIRSRSVLAAATAVLLAGGLAACGSGNSLEKSGGSGSGSSKAGSKSKGTLVVGSAGFTESKVLANMYALVLQKAGYTTSVQTVSDREIYEPALEKGDLAVVPEYAATMAEFLNTKINGPKATEQHPVASPDINSTEANLKKLAAQKGLTALAPGKAVDQNAFAVSQTFAAKYHLKTLSDLGRAGVPVTIAAGEECKTRPFCAPGLEKKYGIKVKGIDPKGVGTVPSKQAVQRGTDQLVLTVSTDATLPDFKLTLLQDDKKLQNADNVVPVLNTKKANKPDIAAALEKLTSVLTTQDLATLNRDVDAQRQKPADVAKTYLTQKGLL